MGEIGHAINRGVWKKFGINSWKDMKQHVFGTN